jgi:hypothetical protein
VSYCYLKTNLAHSNPNIKLRLLFLFINFYRRFSATFDMPGKEQWFLWIIIRLVVDCESGAFIEPDLGFGTLTE